MAIVDNNNKYSYNDVYELSKVIAYKLKSLGIKKGDYISIELPSSAGYYFARFGSWMNGAVVICLSDKTPLARKKEIYKICNVKCVINQSFINDALKDNKKIDDREIVENHLSDAAFVIFTSGSTGKPKGVLHSHKSATYIIKRQIINAEIDKAGRHACYANPEFIAFSGCDFVPLFFGGTLYIVPDEIKENYKELSSFIVSKKINSLLLPAAFLDHLSLKNNSLDYVIVAGSKVSNLYSKDFIIYNTYGASETGGLLYFKIDKKYENTPLGKGAKCGELYLVDDGKQQDDFGEMWFAGNIFDGYINSPKESKIVRIKNPFKDQDGFEYVYRTGDYGRRLPNGDIVFAGRADFMVKINGQRVEPSEIESKLNKFSGIKESVVKPFKHNGKDYLCAYYVAKNNLDEDKIREYLVTQLPKYMVPSFYVQQKNFKRNKNGKVEYKLLKIPNITKENFVQDVSLSKTEIKVLSLFSKVLQISNVSLDDDFIKLGGTSIEAIQLANLISHYKFSSADVLRQRTPKKIARTIDELKEFKLNRKYNLKSGRPLTPSQLSMYLDIQMGDKSNAYTLFHKIKVSKKYSNKQIVDALYKMIDIHPELKACLSIKDNNPWIKYNGNPKVLSINAKKIQPEILKTYNFILDKELCRFYVSSSNSSKYIYAIFHHIIFDLYSFKQFKDDLFLILENNEVKEDRFMFDNCLYKQRIFYDNKRSSMAYYNKAFENLDSCEKLLHDNDSNECTSYKYKFKVNRSLFEKLIKTNEISPGSYFTSMFAFVLSKFTGSNNVQFCVTTSGRDSISNKNAIGMYANTFPLLFDCKDKKLNEYLIDCNDKYYKAIKYQDFPLHELVNKYSIDGQTVFQYIPYDPELNDDVFSISENDKDSFEKLGDKKAMNDLIVYIIDQKDYFYIDATFSGKYSKYKIQSFIQAFILAVKTSLKSNYLSDIDYCTNKSLNILDKVNNSNLNLKYKDIIDVFKINVKRFPNRPCVTYEDVSFTNKEVDYISNYIADKIRKLGISKNQCVSFISHRSHWYLINLIALLKASVIYVPIDETLPINRIDYMLKNSHSKATIVTKELLDNNSEISKYFTKKKNLIIIDDGIVHKAIRNKTKFSNKTPDGYATSGIVYTSGTTGEPKGVCLTRIGCLNLAAWYNTRFKIDENDVYAYYPSVGFVVHLNMFYAIYAGACVDIVPDYVRLDMRKLNEYFLKRNITHSFLTSRVAEDFFTTQNNTKLKFVQKGGEKIEEFPYSGDTFIFEGYGASETNAASVYCPKTEKNVSNCIGYPLSNTNAYIIDECGKRVPPYAIGELCIAGYQVANCYLEDKELSNKVFVNNPFCKKNSKYSRMFKTGDYAYLQNDGKIINVGRRDSTIKIRGNRVELSEVELQIKKLDWISSVAVKSIVNKNAIELVAYVVLDKKADKKLHDNDVLFKKITEYVGANKPSFMVPTYVIKLNEIPLNINGKIDSKKLPKPKTNNNNIKYAKPNNKIEAEICHAFSTVFDIDKIGINDDFIMLGGDSLVAIKLLSILNNYSLSAVDFTNLRTPKKISEKISRKNLVKSQVDSRYLKKGVSLNEKQLNVYLDISMRKNNSSYNIPIEIDIKNYSTNEVKKAIKSVVSSHPILKSYIRQKDDDIKLFESNKFEIQCKNKVTKTFVNEFINKSFDLKNCLSRFLIIENSHKLYAVFHHLVFDGLSTEVFIRHFESALKGIKINKEFEFIRQKDFENKIKNSNTFKDAKEFYDNLFSPVEQIPDLLPDINVKTPKNLIRKLNISNNVINTFVKEKSITKNVLFSSVFAYTLSRFTNSDDSYFTWTENGRDSIDSQQAIGMFVNTLPVIINCRDQKVDDFLSAAKEIIFKTQEYNFYPFRLLSNKYNLHNNINFQYRPYLNNFESLGEHLNFKLLQDNDLISDLSFTIQETQSSLEAHVSSSSKISKATISRFLDVYELILNDIMRKDSLSDIDYSIESDIDLLNEFNDNDANIKFVDILDAFNSSVKKYPDNVFVKQGDYQLTYQESLKLINSLSDSINRKSKSKIVSIFTERSCNYAIAAMSVLNCGYAYMPIDDNYPDKRIDFMIKDSHSDICIVSNETYERAKRITSMKLINIDKLKESKSNRLLKYKFDQNIPAIILYTSGSTGNPKGAILPRRSILSFSDWCCSATKLKASDCFAMYCSFGFDVHAEALFSAAYVGACVDIVPNKLRNNLKDLIYYFEQHNITHVELSTAITKLLFSYRVPRTLKYLLTGGEALGDFQQKTSCNFYDTYGPTEAMVSVSYVKIKDKIDPSSIGKLTSNTKAYILDKERRPVPFGAPGELYLSGLQLANGYLGDNKITKESFFKNPYSNCKYYDTLYKTGDICRFLPDNTIGYIGRLDSQVKVRGNRVELGEVEDAIRNLSDVKDVTVDAIKHEDTYDLVAYVVSNNKDISNAIRSYMERNKPSYMVPSHIVLLDKIPLNANMKVDKSKLPKVNFYDKQNKYIGPKTKHQKIVCDAFKSIFSVKKVGINDDFISLGGDSLLAIKLSSILGVDNLGPSEIMNLKTPQNISNKLINDDFSDIPIKSYRISQKIPLSEQQLNVYLDILTNNMKDSYLIPFKLKLSNYSLKDIKSAVDKCIDACPILSFCIESNENMSYMKINKKPKVEFVDKDNKTFKENFGKTKFNINECLAKFYICKDSHNLYGVVHHVIFDGLSINNFCNKILQLLNNKEIKRDVAFLKSSAFSESVKNTQIYKEAEHYYDKLFGGIDEFTSLLDDVKVKCGSYTSKNLNFNKNEIARFLQNYGTSKNVLFTSAFAYTLSRFTNSSSVQFSLIDNGRHHINAYDSLGMYVNTIPLIINCSNMSIGDYILAVNNHINLGLKYDFYPYRLLSKKYKINNTIDFQYFPNYDDNNSNILNDDDEFMTEDYFKRSDFINDFSFVIKEEKNSYTISVECSNKISSNTAKSFINTFENIVNGFLSNKKLGDINYCPNSHISKLDNYNVTEKKIIYRDILEAFNNSVQKYPNNCFVRYKDIEISYKNALYFINNLSDALNGKSKSGRVVIFTERSHYYALASLAILNLGYAYVPIDDTYPDNRIKFIIKNSDADVVIASDNTINRVKAITNHKIINIDKIQYHVNRRKLNVNFDKENQAIILYTSGTTGRPKGAVLPRRSILSFSDWCCWKTKLKPSDNFAMFCSFGFDVHAEALFSALYVGATVDIIPNSLRTNLKQLVDYLENHKVTHIELSTAITKLLFAERIPNTFKFLLTGGEALGDFNKKTDCSFYDTYGPTEAMVSVTYVDISKKIDPSSIGYLTSNTKAYILDDELRRVPFGAPGELYLSGLQVAKEYLNNKKATSSSFIKNPYSEDTDYNILYKTGDIVRFLPDKSLGFVGRSDTQVKVRGNRIELGEVESAVRQLKDIKDVTIQVINNNGVNELVAYVVSDNKEIDNLVIDHIKKNKPSYMVPSHIVLLDEIPLNSNMKVDKSRLPEIDISQSRSDFISPKTEEEIKICKAFEQVFNVNNIGLNDDFISLGGDSISAIRLSSCLSKMNIILDASKILDLRTPLEISKAIVTKNIKNYQRVVGDVKLSPIQKCYFDTINNDKFAQFIILEAKEKLQLPRLQEAFDKLIDIHDVLRSKFKENGKVTILSPSKKIIKIKNLKIKKVTSEVLANEISKSINKLSLNNNNLIDVKLINEKFIILIIHHLIVDGVSWSIIADDLCSFYNGKVLPRNLPYVNYFDNYEKTLRKSSNNVIDYINEMLNTVNEDEIRGSAQPFIYKFKNNYNITNNYLLTEKEFLLLVISRAYKKTYSKDIFIEMESHGRFSNFGDANQTVGWFTSLYPMKFNVEAKEDSFSVMSDIFSIRKSLLLENNLEIEYLYNCYTAKKFKYKHMPVSFNYLSDEFKIENDLFNSRNLSIKHFRNVLNKMADEYIYGIEFNITKDSDYYLVNGVCAKNNYIHDKQNEFLENISKESQYISSVINDKSYVYPLNEEQSLFYLDEKINKKDSAYSCFGYVKLDKRCDKKFATKCINTFLAKHPILKTRVIEHDGSLYGITDSQPSVSFCNDKFNKNKLSSFIRPFDLSKYSSCFEVVINDFSTYVIYDMHHIISDATSQIIIEKELYDLFNESIVPKFDDVFFAKAIEDFNNQYSNEAKLAKDYFDKELNAHDQFEDLIEDETNEFGGLYNINIVNLKSEVENLANKLSVTPNSIFMAAFAYTYSRFTHSDKAYFTFTNHGRHSKQFEDSIGMFTKIMPVVVDTNIKNKDNYIKHVSQSILDSVKHSIYPFSKLSKDYSLNKKVCFEYNNTLNDLSEINKYMGYNRDDVKSKSHPSQLLAVINDYEDGYVLSLEHSYHYNKNLVISFGDTFVNVLNGLISESKIDKIQYANNTDIELFDRINQQNEVKLSFNDIIESFAFNVKKYPNRPCVRDENICFTYSEVDKITNKLGSIIKKNNINTGMLVSFMTNRSIWYPICMITLLKFNMPYVPLDKELPNNRIKFIIKDANVSACLVSPDCLDIVEKCFDKEKTKIIIVDDKLIRDALKLKTKNNNYHSFNDFNETAAIVYTSGTTGKPKGVCINRKGILNLATWYKKAFKIKSNDIYGYYSSIGFVVHLQMFYALYAGACVDVIPESARLDMDLLNNYCVAHRITHIFLTSRVAEEFFTKYKNNKIKVLQKGGEKVEEFFYDGDTYIFEGYGATETGAASMYCPKDEKRFSSEIGLPVSNLHAYLLDNEGRRVPKYAIGELCISGVQVANGYLNDSKLSKSIFVENHIEKVPYSTKMYNTGDFAYYLHDGRIVNIGRRDSLIKINGNRVSLSEIEECINQLSGVSTSNVSFINVDSNNLIIAYVVFEKDFYSKHDETFLYSYITEHVRKEKPNYMVPSFVVSIDKIPLNINGKVDKSKLPVPAKDRHLHGNEKPQTMMQKTIAKCVSDTLNIKSSKLSINDNLIMLGLNSLSCIKLLSLFNDQGFVIDARQMLKNPTIKYWEEIICNNQRQNSTTIVGKSNLYPLTDSALFIYDLLQDMKDIPKNNAIFNTPKAFIVKNRTVEEIKSAIYAALDLHPAFKSIIVKKNNSLYFKHRPNWKPVINVKTIDFIPDTEFFSKLQIPFKFSGGDLFRVWLFKYNKEVYVYIDIHHIITDGTSNEIFCNDIFNLLKSNTASNEQINFIEFSNRQNIRYKSNLYSQDDKYFNKITNGFANSDFPRVTKWREIMESKISNNEDYKYGLLTNEYLRSDVYSYCKKHNVSVSCFFLSSIIYTYKLAFGSGKIMISSIESGRKTSDLSNLCGCLFGIFPVSCDTKEKEFNAILDEINEQTTNSYMYDFNYRSFRDNLSSTNIFYNYHAEFEEKFSMTNDEFHNLIDEIDSGMNINMPFNISFSVDTYDNKFGITVVYKSELYKNKELKKFMSILNNNINKLICS